MTLEERELKTRKEIEAMRKGTQCDEDETGVCDDRAAMKIVNEWTIGQTCHCTRQGALVVQVTLTCNGMQLGHSDYGLSRSRRRHLDVLDTLLQAWRAVSGGKSAQTARN